MCGRYVSFSTPEQLAEAFAVDVVRAEPLPARYNVAPSLDVHAIVEAEGQRRLGNLRWGLVPFWAKAIKGARAPINARLDSVMDKPMFSRAFATRRCIIPADGYYEWQTLADGATKQPHYIHQSDGGPLAFAGVWGRWRDPADPEVPPIHSCAIITTHAAGAAAHLHDRMPVVLPPDVWSDYLGHDAQPDELAARLAALAPPDLASYAVTTRVNNVRNEGPELLERATG